MIQYSIYNQWSLKSFEVRVDGIRETSETIASECDITFELYRNTAVQPGVCRPLVRFKNTLFNYVA